MNANPDDPEEFKQEVAAICQLYEQAPALAEQGIHLVSTDEMTGIQALERAHTTASLVRLVAACCQIDADLGIKEKAGILKSMESRKAFLSDSTHRIRLVYIPKHTSWLNQIECWFSILVRRLLRRASFTSTTELTQRILEFIDYFNRTMSKPFQWKYKGSKKLV